MDRYRRDFIVSMKFKPTVIIFTMLAGWFF
jgi:hypothetical protein